MKSKPRTHEYKAFEGALRHVLTISKDELLRREAEEKRANADKPKRGPRPKSQR